LVVVVVVVVVRGGRVFVARCFAREKEGIGKEEARFVFHRIMSDNITSGTAWRLENIFMIDVLIE
jgi:hypothetical protein